MDLYYDTQYGGGNGIGRIYVGAPDQRGSGIGAFLGGVFRYVLPLLKRSAKAVGKEALAATANIMADVGERQTPLREALKTRMRESGNNLKRKADENLTRFMHGEGYKVKRAALPPHLLAVLDTHKKKKTTKKKKRGGKKKKRTVRLSRKKKPGKRKPKKVVGKKRRQKKKKKSSAFVDIFK